MWKAEGSPVHGTVTRELVNWQGMNCDCFLWLRWIIQIKHIHTLIIVHLRKLNVDCRICEITKKTVFSLYSSFKTVTVAIFNQHAAWLSAAVMQTRCYTVHLFSNESHFITVVSLLLLNCLSLELRNRSTSQSFNCILFPTVEFKYFIFKYLISKCALILNMQHADTKPLECSLVFWRFWGIYGIAALTVFAETSDSSLDLFSIRYTWWEKFILPFLCLSHHKRPWSLKSCPYRRDSAWNPLYLIMGDRK